MPVLLNSLYLPKLTLLVKMKRLHVLKQSLVNDALGHPPEF